MKSFLNLIIGLNKQKRLLNTLLLFSIALGQKEPDIWEDPQVIEENKLKPHATLIPYDSIEDAITCKKEISSRFKSQFQNLIGSNFVKYSQVLIFIFISFWIINS